MNALDNVPVATIVTVLVAIVGAVIAIVHPETLSFTEYAKTLGYTGAGLGILGIARAQSGKGISR